MCCYEYLLCRLLLVLSLLLPSLSSTSGDGFTFSLAWCTATCQSTPPQLPQWWTCEPRSKQTQPLRVLKTSHEDKFTLPSTYYWHHGAQIWIYQPFLFFLSVKMKLNETYLPRVTLSIFISATSVPQSTPGARRSWGSMLWKITVLIMEPDYLTGILIQAN